MNEELLAMFEYIINQWRKMKISKSKILSITILILGLSSGTAQAIEHPACGGKDNNVCDTFALMINLKGKGCFRLMKVEPKGGEKYRLTCELASYDKSKISYTFKFANNKKSYTVY